MSNTVTTWEQLWALLEDINTRFNNGAATETCPAEARLHLVYAHKAALVDPDETLRNGVSGPQAYESAEEPKHATVFKDFLGSRLLWTPIEGAELNRVPNLRQPGTPTTIADGTLLHFEHTQFNPVAFKVECKAPSDDDSDTYHPPRRRLCLSIPGSAGSHADVDAPSGSQVSAELDYPVATQDTALRLFAVAPGFDFEFRPAPPRNGEQQTAEPQAATITDPWTDSPRGLADKYGWSLHEKSASFWVGNMTRYRYQGNYLYGLQKKAGQAGTTTTFDLAERHSADLGASRVTVFKAVKEIEGACESVASYDGPKISWGINQWIRAELWQIVAYIADFFPDAFARRFGWFGIGVHFTSRNTRWGKYDTYRNVNVYRVPCCGSTTRSALDAILAPKDGPIRPALARAIPINFNQDTTSYAMHYVFSAAGTDQDIQRAQAEWMSFRISSTNPVGKTLDTVVDDFLKSLGSNMPAADRLTKARAALGDQAATLLAETFSDDGASTAWTDWATRCDNANKARTGSETTRPQTQGQQTRGTQSQLAPTTVPVPRPRPAPPPPRP